MTIFPVTNMMPSQALSTLAATEAAPPVNGVAAFPDTAAGIMPAPGAQVAQGAVSEVMPPTPVGSAAGGTLGDEILAGLNKRWTRFSKALSESPGRAMHMEADNADFTQPKGSPLSDRNAESAWSSIDDSDYDAHIDRMAEIDALQRHVRDIDDGGALTLQLSKGVQGLQSSIKSLVTGQ